MNQVTISSDYKIVNIPPDMLEEVKYLVKNSRSLSFYYDKVSSNMKYAYFDDIVTDLVNSCNFRLELIDNKELDPNIIEEYKKILPVQNNNKEYSNILSYYFSHDADLRYQRFRKIWQQKPEALHEHINVKYLQKNSF